MALHRLRQLRKRARDPVLHQNLREIEIDADLEGDCQRVAAVRTAQGLHIEHVLDAIDLLLDGQRHRVDDGAGTGTRITRGHLNSWWHHIGILRHRQLKQGGSTDDNHQNGDDIRQDWPFDEELGNHIGLLRSAGGVTRLHLWVDLLAWYRAQQAGHHDAVIGLEPGADDTHVVDLGADLHLALLDDIVGIDDQHVTAALITAESDVEHHQHWLARSTSAP